MALLNTGCLISTIQADVTGITTGYAAECFAVLAAAVDSATQDRCVTVPTSGSLPSLYPTQTIPQGQVMFVEDVGVPVIAASGKWIGFDQRAFRYDFPTKTLYTWGCGNALGVGANTSRSSPGTTVGNIVTWSSVSAGQDAAAGIKTDGTLWTWGVGNYGMLGNGAGYTTNSPGTTAGGGTNWCRISVGSAHMAGIKTDGTLWTWGYNGSGQLGTGNTTSRNSPGTVAGGGSTWCQVSAARAYTVAVKTDGTFWSWGANGYGQLGNATNTNRSSPGTLSGGGTIWCKAIASSMSCHTAGLKTDGTICTWGAGGYGRLGGGSTANINAPSAVSGGGTTWCDAAVGSNFTVALKSDNTLWTWGHNGYGTLGTGTTTNRSSPGTVAGGGSTWCSASSGLSHTAAVKTDGTLWTWGCNGNGRLGDGTTTNRSSPGTTAGGGTTWSAVGAGQLYSLGLR